MQLVETRGERNVSSFVSDEHTMPTPHRIAKTQVTVKPLYSEQSRDTKTVYYTGVFTQEVHQDFHIPLPLQNVIHSTKRNAKLTTQIS